MLPHLTLYHTSTIKQTPNEVSTDICFRSLTIVHYVMLYKFLYLTAQKVYDLGPLFCFTCKLRHGYIFETE